MKNVECKIELILAHYTNQKFTHHSSFIILNSVFHHVV